MGRIDTELHIIQNNRYGEDVRMAIHDALDKLEKTSGGGGGTEGIIFDASLCTNSTKGFNKVCTLETTEIIVDTSDLERGDISSSGGNISSNYYLRFKSSAKYEFPEGSLSIRAKVTLASSVSSYTPRFGIAYYDANDNFLSINYYYSNNQWVTLPSNAAKVRYTISYTNGNSILPEHIESMIIETY